MVAKITLEDIAKHAFDDEHQIVRQLLDKSSVYQNKADKIFKRAKKYVEQIREDNDSLSVETFLGEYSLDSYEGVAIMCLAEALLRIPDEDAADELIRDKLEKGNWKKHFNKDSGLLLNSSTYGLMLSGKILSLSNDSDKIESALMKMVGRVGEPIIRESLKKGMQILGQKFVLGTNINKALDKAKKVGKKGYIFSYDMLGEGRPHSRPGKKIL
jgi:RHH-type proline utilization regulon transcriptional repressor/proline dehydrogenase/delta 1-pyrroline-5-carboxylate dehydrogenase